MRASMEMTRMMMIQMMTVYQRTPKRCKSNIESSDSILTLISRY